MKVAPVSSDLIVKAVAGAVILGGLVYLVTKISGAVSDTVGSVVDTVTESASTTFNPASDQNFVYEGVNSIGAWATDTPPGDWSLGTWLYDITHDDPLASQPQKNTGGASGSW